MLAMAWLPLWGQVVVPDSASRAIPADSVAVDEEDDEPNVIGAQPSVRKPKGEANILGAPVYYDRDGGVRGEHPRHYRNGEAPSSGRYQMPKHHYLNNLGTNFSSFFFEIETLLGPRDIAIGANLTYLPERWGVYGSALYGHYRNYWSVGPAVRLSGRDSFFDWQLYGGAMFADRRLGGEVGIRIASQARRSEFCWTSASLGWAFINGDSYLTVGLSLEVTALTALAFFFW